ncbi:hypothetical protein CYMTET_33042 [Cymbomonas tetramitiformis]|uniref:J domain-containing protein n=1 Tax=Cymbomonas tetramitiformis TaxID=36881 RepID=A0AAE0FEI5_9CHLO|nr:hypothetical protein CYMTET_33042 [Cymbomonas tetramitiformis]
MADLEDLTVTELKRRLQAAGVAYADCFEKADLVRRARASGVSATGEGARPSAGSSSQDPRSQKKNPGKEQASGPSSPAAGKGTPAQQVLVKQVTRTNDYYEILGVTKSCTEDELKKAYRKMALQLHPDKCKVAGAEEAFKKVNKAFDALSDGDKRANYDRFGTEDPGGMGGGGGGMSPEDIFAQFFNGAQGGGFHAGGPGMRGQQFHFNVEDLFGQFAGGRPRQGNRAQPGQQQQGQQRQQQQGRPQSAFDVLNNFSLQNLCVPILIHP